MRRSFILVGWFGKPNETDEEGLEKSLREDVQSPREHPVMKASVVVSGDVHMQFFFSFRGCSCGMTANSANKPHKNPHLSTQPQSHKLCRMFQSFPQQKKNRPTSPPSTPQNTPVYPPPTGHPPAKRVKLDGLTSAAVSAPPLTPVETQTFSQIDPERAAGITEYIDADLKGWCGILKQRYVIDRGD